MLHTDTHRLSQCVMEVAYEKDWTSSGAILEFSMGVQVKWEWDSIGHPLPWSQAECQSQGGHRRARGSSEHRSCSTPALSTCAAGSRGRGGSEGSCGAVLEVAVPVPSTKQDSVEWKLMRETGKDLPCPESWVAVLPCHIKYKQESQWA